MSLWTIILAGGEGVRLRPLTRRICGDDRPKQYVPLLEARSLLGQTLDRVARISPPERTVVVTQRRHSKYIADEFRARPAPRVLIQPDDRGTAAGVLPPAHWIRWRDPEVLVSVFPADHLILEEDLFAGHVSAVAGYVTTHPERIVLLAARATEPETGYGWIEPGEPLGVAGGEPIFEVRRFWEKPSPEGALACLQAGSLLTEAHDQADIDTALRHFEGDPAACVVIDLSTVAYAGKVGMIERCLLAIREMRRWLGFPHWVVLDEVHYSLHREGVAERAFAAEDKGLCLVTYKSSWVRPLVMSAIDVLIFARTTAAHEVAFLCSLLAESGSSSGGVFSALATLPPGKFVVMRKEGGGAWAALTFTAAPRATPHVRHLRKYADVSVRPEHAFLFRGPDGCVVATADSLNGFRRIAATAADAVLAYHAGRHDFSRWVRGVFADPELAAQLRKAERRWRRGEVADLRGLIDELIAVRYWSEEL